MLEHLKIGEVAGTTVAPDTSHDGHNHKRSLRYNTRSKRSAEDHDEHDHEESAVTSQVIFI